MSDSPIAKKIKINYEKDKNYRIIYADDVLVGQTVTNGGLTIDFFTGNWVPRNEVHIWSDEKKMFDILSEDDEFTSYIRTLQMQIVMTPESIEGMIKALTERLKLLKESKSDKK